MAVRNLEKIEGFKNWFFGNGLFSKIDYQVFGIPVELSTVSFVEKNF